MPDSESPDLTKQAGHDSTADQAVVPDDLKAIVQLEKPFRAAELINAAASVHQAANTGKL